MKKIIMIIMAVALIALPTMAQQEQWQTSTMQASGSAYGSQVTPVGATSAPSEATTTASYAPGRLGAGVKTAGSLPGKPTNDEGDEGNVPIGEPWMLAIFAAAFAAVIAVRRRRTLNRKDVKPLNG